MRVLVVGSGGREHAITRALVRDGARVSVAPGNAGTSEIADNVGGMATVDDIVAFARRESFELVVVGPEALLVKGLGDALRSKGVACCGPDATCARLEGSKIFTRKLGAEIGLPQPAFASVLNGDEIDPAIASLPAGIPVVKADGLAGGKGVSLPDTMAGVRRDTLTQLERGSVVLEERLVGVEASLFYACSGEDFVELPNAKDHKRLFDGQKGPNTGGMGAVSPNPDLDDEARQRVRDEIVSPTLSALMARGMAYRGFLYVGVMLTATGPKLVEFNVRLGDPESQCILPRLGEGEFLDLCARTAENNLNGFSLSVDPRPTVSVVLAADGYPASARRGDVVEIDDAFETGDRWLDHAGLELRDGHLLTAGGRVAAVVARSDSVASARQLAYLGVEHVHFDGKHCRGDIGA